MSGRIRLHPEHGINPTIPTYQCPATGKVWESNEIAMLGYNRGQEAKKNTHMGLQFCPEVQEKLEAGYVVLVGVEEAKTTDFENPYRTGDILYMRKEVAQDFFDKQVETMAYVEKEVIERLKGKAMEAESNAGEG